MDAYKVQGWAAPRTPPKKRNCDFGYLWLFIVIFIQIFGPVRLPPLPFLLK
jgi:hypothetical protein